MSGLVNPNPVVYDRKRTSIPAANAGDYLDSVLVYGALLFSPLARDVSLTTRSMRTSPLKDIIRDIKGEDKVL